MLLIHHSNHQVLLLVVVDLDTMISQKDMASSLFHFIIIFYVCNEFIEKKLMKRHLFPMVHVHRQQCYHHRRPQINCPLRLSWIMHYRQALYRYREHDPESGKYYRIIPSNHNISLLFEYYFRTYGSHRCSLPCTNITQNYRWIICQVMQLLRYLQWVLQHHRRHRHQMSHRQHWLWMAPWYQMLHATITCQRMVADYYQRVQNMDRVRSTIVLTIQTHHNDPIRHK